jgi:steroid delta-isomerase-like uncharacterized protein
MSDDDTLEKNKAIMRRMLDAFNTGDTNVVTELLHPLINDRSRPIGFESELHSKRSTSRRVRTKIMRKEDAFPDRLFVEESLVAEGDIVILRWSMTGTHLGPFFGRPATGKQIRTQGTEFVRIRDGKLVEHDSDGSWVFDVLWQLDLLDKDFVQKLDRGDRDLGARMRTAEPL